MKTWSWHTCVVLGFVTLKLGVTMDQNLPKMSYQLFPNEWLRLPFTRTSVPTEIGIWEATLFASLIGGKTELEISGWCTGKWAIDRRLWTLASRASDKLTDFDDHDAERIFLPSQIDHPRSLDLRSLTIALPRVVEGEVLGLGRGLFHDFCWVFVTDEDGERDGQDMPHA